MKKIERILVFADPHLFTKADRIQKEKEENLPIGERLFLKASDLLFGSEAEKDSLHQEYFQKMIRKIKELKKSKISFGRLIDLGDATFGSYNQGLIYPESQKERLHYNDLIKTSFPSVKKIFVTGNHDVGFQDNVSRLFNLGYWNKGISKKSFEVAERLIGPAWDLFKVKNFNLLMLNSEVIRAVNTIESVDISERPFFIKKEEKQKIFIEKAFEEPGPFILIIHDPYQLKYLWPILKHHSHRICLTLAGHLHSADSGKALRRHSKIYRELNLKVIPSLWSWANRIVIKIIGKKYGGFAILELSEHSFKLNHYWL